MLKIQKRGLKPRQRRCFWEYRDDFAEIWAACLNMEDMERTLEKGVDFAKTWRLKKIGCGWNKV